MKFSGETAKRELTFAWWKKLILDFGCWLLGHQPVHEQYGIRCNRCWSVLKGEKLTMLSTTKRLSVLGLILCLVMSNTGCDEAKTVIKYVNRAMPLLTAVGVDISDAREVIDLMNQFEKDPNAALLSATTLAFDRLVLKAQQIPEQGKRTAVMVILVGANIALQELADKYFQKATENPDDPRFGAPAARMQIRRFSQKKRWVCRAAGNVEKYKAGQFMPMSMCKKYPDNSVVETQ